MPAFDEEPAIAATVAGVRAVLAGRGIAHEVLVVDDGSRDRTGELATAAGATVLRSAANRGYGAALRAGIARARFEVIAILDADGTYPAEALPALIEALEGHEMVVGARTADPVSIPRLRLPAKWALRLLASWVTGHDIPDLNSGMRVMRRPLVRRFEPLLPQGFSFTTTITMASLATGAPVCFVPISYGARLGTSKLRSHHALPILWLILRLGLRFRPWRVLLPLGSLFLLAALVAAALGGRGAAEPAVLVLSLAALLTLVLGVARSGQARVPEGRGGTQ